MTTGSDSVDRVIAQLTEACLAAHQAVMQHGTPEMQSISYALLLALGTALANEQLPVQVAQDPA